MGKDCAPPWVLSFLKVATHAAPCGLHVILCDGGWTLPSSHQRLAPTLLVVPPQGAESNICRAEILPECGFIATCSAIVPARRPQLCDHFRAVNGKFFALRADSARIKADVALKAPSAATEVAHGKKRVVPPFPPDPPEGGPLSRPSLARARPTAFFAPQCGRGGFVGSTAQWPGSSLSPPRK